MNTTPDREEPLALKHLAQVNIAEQRYPNDAPEMADFMGALNAINALAERSPGFVWRMQDETGHAMDLRFESRAEAADLLINMSVWESVETLRDYVYTTAHANVMARRAKWFPKMETSHMALWWIEAGTVPTIEDARAAIASLNARGPAPEAFTFDEPFGADGVRLDLPAITKLCA
ncbi:MAG: DUF3291 domain-containing protein [Pseudomonadota bacterium]